MGVIVIIISVIVVISIVAKSKKSKIWVPGPFVGTWKNDKYRVILRENSIQIWNNEIGMLDLPSYIIEQGYRGGYSFIAKKGQEIFSVNFIGIGDRINFNSVIFVISKIIVRAQAVSIEDTKMIVRENLQRE
jgi:hypothetical protein